jgi:hypothetical protein
LKDRNPVQSDLLALPEVIEPPFRSYRSFLERTVNWMNVGDIHLTQEEVERAPTKWLYYHVLKKPNPFSGKIKLRDDLIVSIGGIRGGGKSALLFNIAAHWPKVIGLYGALDDEVLALLRAHKYLGKWERALILGPEGVSVTSSWDYKYYGDLTFNDMQNYEVIVMPQRIHRFPKTFSMGCEYVSNFLLRRPKVSEYWFLCITEAANILWARQSLKNAKLENAKSYLVWLLRQLRHVGIAVGLDSQYLLALDKEVRNISDYTFLKNLGAFSLPRDLEWVYRYVTPWAMRALYPNEFVAVDKFSGTYAGWFRLPPWHKQPKEDIYESLGIRYEFGDPEMRSVDIPRHSAEMEDLVIEEEIVKAYTDSARKDSYMSIKGTARATGHDRDTVRKYVAMHESKKCQHFLRDETE